MRRLLAVFAIVATVKTSFAEKRTMPCKTPELAASCFVTRGRLRYGNGTPALRLWQIGTNHEFGIFSGLYSELRDPSDNEHPHLPRNVDRGFSGPNPFEPTIYADFEVCPLERHIPGHMQAACIESATHVFVKKD